MRKLYCMRHVYCKMRLHCRAGRDAPRSEAEAARLLRPMLRPRANEAPRLAPRFGGMSGGQAPSNRSRAGTRLRKVQRRGRARRR